MSEQSGNKYTMLGLLLLGPFVVFAGLWLCNPAKTTVLAVMLAAGLFFLLLRVLRPIAALFFR